MVRGNIECHQKSEFRRFLRRVCLDDFMDKIIKYGLVVLRDGKFLINREHGTEFFLMPGGSPEEGEGVEECLVREIKEELGCDVVKESVKFFGDFEGVAINHPGRLVSMKLFLGEISGDPEPNSEIEEQRWFGREDDQSVLSPLLKNKIFPALIDGGLLG